MSNKWDERYAGEDYAYGTEPNAFIKEQLLHLKPGKILFPAEGEGRNAVYAATQGWEVYAFDLSVEGRKKALKLATENGVPLQYDIATFETYTCTPHSMDAVALVYAHVPANVKDASYAKVIDWVKPGGTIIMEAFSKNHIGYKKADSRIGGPDEPDMLFSEDEIKAYFPSVDILLLEEREITLHEGSFHNGAGSVIRFVGRKK